MLRLNRRDLSLDGTEDATLQFTVVDQDSASGVPLNLVSPAGSALLVNVWYRSWAWDYGRPTYSDAWGPLLWSSVGTILPSPAGRVDVLIPSGTVATWRGELEWTAQLTYAAAKSTLLRGAIAVHV
jgi:hypothetical protein